MFTALWNQLLRTHCFKTKCSKSRFIRLGELPPRAMGKLQGGDIFWPGTVRANLHMKRQAKDGEKGFTVLVMEVGMGLGLEYFFRSLSMSCV